MCHPSPLPKSITSNVISGEKLMLELLPLHGSLKETRVGEARQGTLQSGTCSRKWVRIWAGAAGARCWFKFGKSGVDAEGAGIYGSQSGEDFDRDAIEYVRYKMGALLNQDIHPVDILLTLAASEGDRPNIEELLRAGALYTVRDADRRTDPDRASSEIREFKLEFSAQKA